MEATHCAHFPISPPGEWCLFGEFTQINSDGIESRIRNRFQLLLPFGFGGESVETPTAFDDPTTVISGSQGFHLRSVTMTATSRKTKTKQITNSTTVNRSWLSEWAGSSRKFIDNSFHLQLHSPSFKVCLLNGSQDDVKSLDVSNSKQTSANWRRDYQLDAKHSATGIHLAAISSKRPEMQWLHFPVWIPITRTSDATRIRFQREFQT